MYFDNLIKRANAFIDDKWRQKKTCVKFFSLFYRMLLPFDKSFREELSKSVDMCRHEEHVSRSVIVNDMLSEYIKNWISPKEYCQFGLYNKDESSRKTFISIHNGLKIYKSAAMNILPNNKYERYQMFSAYYNRSIVRVDNQMTPDEREAYEAFAASHSDYMIKPIMGSKGHGVEKYHTDTPLNVSELLAKAGGECVLEEIIRQGPELAEFHPESVNTVRFVTGMNPAGELYALFALLRVGRGGSVVDNVGSGGLIALIDMESGIVVTDAYCGFEYFDRHPDTDKQFKGTQIPEWEKLRELAFAMHRSQPKQRIFGFDFAWTENGWDVVEVNPAPSFASYQTLTGQGIRPSLVEKGLL